VIKLLKLHIEEFRGIRELGLDLEGKSFVVHGPNGSGKSGVVDAIGFALTGTIARLTGTGTGGLSVQKHGPHVHRRDDPGAAKVALTFRDAASGQTGTIERTVKSPDSFTLTPDTRELRAALEAVGQHPELTLSRREIIKFILAEAGKRAAEVQALLQLDGLDIQRKSLRSSVSKIARDVTAAESLLTNAHAAMSRHLDIPILAQPEVLRVINEKRLVLEMPTLSELTPETNLKEGLDDESVETPFNKPSAVRDIEALTGWLARADTRETAFDKLKEAIDALGKDAAILDSLKYRSFVETGKSMLIDDGICPLCDVQWESPEQLSMHLEEKIALSQEAARLERAVKTAALELVPVVQAGRGVVRPVRELAVTWGTAAAQLAIESLDESLVALTTQLTTIPALLAVRDRLEAGALPVPDDMVTQLDNLLRLIKAKPDTSAKAQARSHLIIAVERWNALRLAQAANEEASRAHKLAMIVYQTFCEVADAALTALYEDVEGRFSEFYRQINVEDEQTFKAELEPAAGKLDLQVDFYGLGMFPPAAYHSEGHQDGMGVCLYLALVEKLLGSEFSFAVLDDVVMSVDSNHRRQFCELLKKEFPNVQFIITTHDVVWAKQMQSSGLIGRREQVQFHGWTVESGPAAEQGADFWDKINEDLAKSDVPGAAHKLRRGLEASLPELAEDLRARVAYRGDARYELGDFLNAITGRYSDLLGKAANAANSWNNSDAKAQVGLLKAKRDKAMLAQQQEQWTINALVHYNEWADMTSADFKPVVQTWRDFLDLFHCESGECESWIAVSGVPGNEDTLRCSCGEYLLNLRSKPNK
jgi:ABC-type multidrug transport system ATPase subunit